MKKLLLILLMVFVLPGSVEAERKYISTPDFGLKNLEYFDLHGSLVVGLTEENKVSLSFVGVHNSSIYSVLQIETTKNNNPNQFPFIPSDWQELYVTDAALAFWMADFERKAKINLVNLKANLSYKEAKATISKSLYPRGFFYTELTDQGEYISGAFLVNKNSIFKISFRPFNSEQNTPVGSMQVVQVAALSLIP